MSLTIIDIHSHADYLGGTAKKLVADMDANGIGITCLLSWEAPVYDYMPGSKHTLSVFSDYPVPFERCVHFQEQAPDRFLLGFCPDPRRPDAIQRLRAAVKTFDIALCGELKLRMMYDNPDAVRMYRVCAELKLPVLVHIDYELYDDPTAYPWPNWWYGGGIEALERVLALCPETVFIGHAPGFWANISGDGEHLTESYPKGSVTPGGKVPALLDKYPNLFCDISAGSGHNALNRDLTFAKQFLTRYQDRVMYGRDCYETIHRDLLDNLDLPGEILEKIYYKNAVRLLNMAARPDVAALVYQEV